MKLPRRRDAAKIKHDDGHRAARASCCTEKSKRAHLRPAFSRRGRAWVRFTRPKRRVLGCAATIDAPPPAPPAAGVVVGQIGVVGNASPLCVVVVVSNDTSYSDKQVLLTWTVTVTGLVTTLVPEPVPVLLVIWGQDLQFTLCVCVHPHIPPLPVVPTCSSDHMGHTDVPHNP